MGANLAWPLSSSATWSMGLNLPINRNGNTSLPGFLCRFNNQTSEKQSPVPGECSVNVVIIIISTVQAQSGHLGTVALEHSQHSGTVSPLSSLGS